MAKTNGKIRSFKDVWKFPLFYDDSGKVWTVVDEMAFDFEDNNSREGMRYMIVDCLNDEFEESMMPNDTILIYSEGDIYFSTVEDKNRLLTVRGWGHLTGIGGLQLTAKRAAELQEEFGNFIIQRLTHGNTQP